MRDTDLRELKRAKGSLEDELAWLRASLRAGELSRDRLRLAAFLGSPLAKCLAKELSVAPARFSPSTDTRAWIHSCPGFWSEDLLDESWEWLLLVYRRVGVALARGLADSIRTRTVAVLAHQVVARAEEWTLLGREEDRQGGLALLDELHRAGGERAWLPIGKAAADRKTIGALRNATMTLALPSIHVNAGPAEAAAHLERTQGCYRARDLVTEDLLPWALGYGDPVKDRIETRQQTKDVDE